MSEYRVAFLDHSHHQVTGSSAFLPELLRSQGCAVDVFWDESWQGGRSVPLRALLGHDAIVLFQNLPSYFGSLAKKHPCITYVPMLDAFGITCEQGRDYSAFWHCLHGIKILCLSRALQSAASACGLHTVYARYYQKPHNQRQIPLGCGLHGFFWCRRPDRISLQDIRILIGDTRFDSFHIHLATDPGTASADPASFDSPPGCALTVSHWFEDNHAYLEKLAHANVFFAPRPEEGIGQPLLESLAMGQCVVAPDCGTMNEYIIHGVNGLLYDLRNPRPLDFSRAHTLGQAGRESAMAGYQQWSEAAVALNAYIINPSALYYQGLRKPVPPSPGGANAWARRSVPANWLRQRIKRKGTGA